MIAGGAAGALAAAFTTPLDVMKTLLNTQETGVGLTKGMREAVTQVVCLESKRIRLWKIIDFVRSLFSDWPIRS